MAIFVEGETLNRGSEHERAVSPTIVQIPEEQERYERLGREFANSICTAYKAAGKNIYDYHLMIGDPYHPHFSPFPLPPMMHGWRWPMLKEPFRNKLKRQQGSIVDIVDTSFETYAVSQKVIDIIESIEPGVHQYLPYELIQPDGSAHPDKRWLLNICTRAETIDYARSAVVPQRGAEFFYIETGKRLKLTLRAEAVQGRALWYEYRLCVPGNNFFVSDRLWEALQAAGCRGWRPNYVGNDGPFPELEGGVE